MAANEADHLRIPSSSKIKDFQKMLNLKFEFRIVENGRRRIWGICWFEASRTFSTCTAARAFPQLQISGKFSRAAVSTKFSKFEGDFLDDSSKPSSSREQ